MLKAAVKEYIIQRDTSSAVVLSSLCFAYRICLIIRALHMNKNIMKSYQRILNVYVIRHSIYKPIIFANF